MSLPPPRLVVVADLTIEVGDDAGSTTAHLTSDDAGLLLEIPEPSVLLRCVPGRGLSRDLPVSVPVAQFANLPVRLTSRGRDLGRVHLSSSGRLRLRPSLAGVPTITRTALSSPFGPAVAVTLGAVAVGVGWVVVRRRSRG